jgi:hypothetical protein
VSDLARHGRCRCGLVNFEARGAPLRVGVCHCESCRRATGAAFAVYADYAPDAVTIAGEPAVWSSRPGVERVFCPRCGSPIAFRDESEPRMTSLHLGGFDDPASLGAPHHVTYEHEGLDWARAALAPLTTEKGS